MTPAPAPALIPSSLPDLRSLPFGELASPAALDQVLQRVLPAVPVIATVRTPFTFNSVI